MNIFNCPVRTGLLMILLIPWITPFSQGATLVERADAIVVGEIASGDQGPSSVVFQLRIDRTLKGNLAAGSIIDIEWPGRLMPREKIVGVRGIWLLDARPPKKAWAISSGSSRCRQLSSCPFYIHPAANAEAFARAADVPSIGIDRVSAELAASAEQLPSNNVEFYRTARTLLLDTPRSKGTLTVFKQLRSSGQPAARALGFVGLVMHGDIEALTQVDSEVSDVHSFGLGAELVGAIASQIDPDPRNVSALGRLATSPSTRLGLRRAAVAALRSIHSKETLPFLADLLDSPDSEVRAIVFSALSMFVDNLGIVTPQSIASGSWTTPVGRARWRTAETDKHIGYLGPVPSGSHAEYTAFWTTWWNRNRAEVMK